MLPSCATRLNDGGSGSPNGLVGPGVEVGVPGVTVKRGDLVCVKVRNTGTGKAEVHILTAASNYQQFRLETGTPINEVDASDNYSFTQMAVGDLVAVKSRNTGISGKAGVHILTAASNYQQFRLEKDTPIDEVDASDNYVFVCVK